MEQIQGLGDHMAHRPLAINHCLGTLDYITHSGHNCWREQFIPDFTNSFTYFIAVQKVSSGYVASYVLIKIGSDSFVINKPVRVLGIILVNPLLFKQALSVTIEVVIYLGQNPEKYFLLFVVLPNGQQFSTT